MQLLGNKVIERFSLIRHTERPNQFTHVLIEQLVLKQ